MGFIEETGAAQHLRDARIATIYEGTNGIQAIDLVLRKLPLSGGEAVKALIAEMRGVVAEVAGAEHAGLRPCRRPPRVPRSMRWSARRSGCWRPWARRQADVLAGATPYLKLFALAQGGTGLARKALATKSGESGTADLATARFFAEHLVTEAPALELAVTEGAGAVEDAAAVFAA